MVWRRKQLAKEARSGVTAQQLTAQGNEGRHAGEGQWGRGSWFDLISGRNLFFDLAQQDCDRAWVSFNSAPIWRRGSIWRDGSHCEPGLSQASRCTGPGLNCRGPGDGDFDWQDGIMRPPTARPLPKSMPATRATLSATATNPSPAPHVTSATTHFPSPPWPIFKSPHQIIRFPPPSRPHPTTSPTTSDIATTPSKCRYVLLGAAFTPEFSIFDPELHPSRPRERWERCNSCSSGGFHTSAWANHHRKTEPQDFPHEAEARQGAEAEPPHSPMDSPAHRQHHQVRRPHHEHTRQACRTGGTRRRC